MHDQWNAQLVKPVFEGIGGDRAAKKKAAKKK
jgi:hypothetical protein